MLVHAEEVSGKDCGLVAAGAAADFHHGVLAVIRICRDKEELDVLLYLREFGLYLRHFLTGHVLEVLVLLVHEYVFGLGKLVHQPLVLKAGGNDGLQLLVVLIQLHELFHVRDYFRVCKLLFQFLVFVLKAKHLLQEGILCHKLLI